MTQMHQKVRTRSGRQVLRATSAIHRFTPHLLRGLETTLSDDGWDVPAECVEGLHRTLGRVLESRLETLQQAIDARRLAAQEGKRLREHRDRAAREVYGLLVRLRRLVSGMAGTDGERAVFGTGKTPREPRAVALTARELQGRLGSEDVRHELSRGFGGRSVLDAWRCEVEAPLARLEEWLDRVDCLAAGEADAVQGVREARRAMRRAEIHALKIVEGFYGLAELEELGNRLRHREPTARGDENTTGAARAPAGETMEEAPSSLPAGGSAANAPEGSPHPPQVRSTGEEAPVTSYEVDRRSREGDASGAAASQELESESREVTAADTPASGPLSPESFRPAAPKVAAHPVRKVLQWLSVVPHRVETPEEPGIATESRERAA